MNYKLNDTSRGSLTVEAALIVPIILFVLFWLVNIAFVLYQYAALQSVANQAVGAAQAGWDNTAKEIRSGRLENSVQLDDEWLYWHIADKDRAIKESSLKSWMLKRLKEDRLMALFIGRTGGDQLNVRVHENRLVGLRETLEVRVTDNRSTLFSPLRSLFGFDTTHEVTVTSRGALQDPAELIRTLDWGADLYSDYLAEHPDGKPADLARKVEEIKGKAIDLLK